MARQAINGRIRLSQGHFVVTFAWDRQSEEVLDSTRALPGRRWNKPSKEWWVPVRPESLEAVRRYAERHGFKVSDDAAMAVAGTSLQRDVEPRIELKRTIAHVQVRTDKSVAKDIAAIGGEWTIWTAHHKVLLTPEAIVGLPAVIDKYELAISDEDQARLTEMLPGARLELEERKDRLDGSYATDASVDLPPLGGELRPFQRAGVAYALNARRCFIADEQGLGKTIQALATIEAADAYPALVVCSASTKLNWYRETAKWLPGRYVEVLSGSDASLLLVSAADVIVINYDILNAWAGQVGGPGQPDEPGDLCSLPLKALVFDESQKLKNPKTQRTRAAQMLSKSVADTAHVLMLSGTPIRSRPAELIPQLEILRRLQEFGGRTRFKKRYSDAGAEHLVELNELLRRTCYVRREKSEVLKDLPAKERAVVPVEIDNRAEYDRAESDLIRWLRDHAGAAAAERASHAEHLARIQALKRLTADGKLKAAIRWIGDFLESGEKLVVFAHHIRIQHALLDKWPGAARILGDDDMNARQESIDRFQTDDDCKLFIASLQAAQEGITLTAASNVAFLELAWTPAEHDQAEDRCHRIGQEDSVTAWYLLGTDTIDEKIAELIEQKRAIVHAATVGEEIEAGGSIVDMLVNELAYREQEVTF